MKWVAIVLSVLASGSQPQAPDSNGDVEAIAELNRLFGDALSSGDVDRLMSMLTDDIIMMAPESPTLEGASAVRARFETTFAEVALVEHWKSFETVIEGDLAYDLSHYTVTITPVGGGEAVEQSGRNLNILRRQPDGGWKFSRLLWNRFPEP